MSSLVLTYSTSAKAVDLPPEQFAATTPPTSDRHFGLWLSDAQSYSNGFAVLEGFSSDGTERGRSLIKDHFVCKGYGIGDCGADKFLTYSTQLEMCSESNSHNCIQSVTATKADGTNVEGQLIELFPGRSEFTYAGNPSVNLPAGGSTFLVKFPGITHNGGDQFLVYADFDGSKASNEKSFQIDDFRTAIFAVSLISGGDYRVPEPETYFRTGSVLGARASRGGGTRWNIKAGVAEPCVTVSKTDCALPWTLPKDVSFKINMKLSSRVQGWVNGHMSNIKTSLTQASDGDQLLSVSGNPTTVPVLFGWIKQNSLSPALKKIYDQDPTSLMRNGSGFPGPNNEENGPEGNPWSIFNDHVQYDLNQFNLVLAWQSTLNDKSSADPTAWSFRTVQSGNGFGQCMNNQSSLGGIVSTNSSMYVASPPNYNKQQGTLEYKVASPHFMANGDVFKGEYDLWIRSDLARCIYGFSSAPVSASVSVVTSGGDNEVATSIMTERDGWMIFNVKNFTFSSPTIQVKLTQNSTPTAFTNTQMKSNTTPMKSTSITCVKGKATKKVTAVSPKCPAGYKKK